MPRFRLLPTAEQEEGLLVALPGRAVCVEFGGGTAIALATGPRAPGYVEQCAQLEQPGVRVAQKRGLNRAISRSGWGQLVARLQHQALGRIEQVSAAYTPQRCSACGHVAPGNRKSQAVFECESCTAGQSNADVNAARNIAAGRAVTARGDLADGRSASREPQLSNPAA